MPLAVVPDDLVRRPVGVIQPERQYFDLTVPGNGRKPHRVAVAPATDHCDEFIQAGDGDGTPDGSNELGYVIPDELPDSADAYVDYSVAMANRGPETSGSQFFVVLPGGGNQLTAAYSIFGKVTEGTEVVDAIGELGGSDQTPSEEVLINSVTIAES